MRRYQILLPLYFNDGTAVPEALSVDVIGALVNRFGAVSYETNAVRGHWMHEGQIYRDDLVRIFVDVPDLPEHRLWFVEFKERLKRDFKQLDIWITTFSVDIL